MLRMFQLSATPRSGSASSGTPRFRRTWMFLYQTTDDVFGGTTRQHSVRSFSPSRSNGFAGRLSAERSRHSPKRPLPRPRRNTPPLTPFPFFHHLSTTHHHVVLITRSLSLVSTSLRWLIIPSTYSGETVSMAFVSAFSLLTSSLDGFALEQRHFSTHGGSKASHRQSTIARNQIGYDCSALWRTRGSGTSPVTFVPHSEFVPPFNFITRILTTMSLQHSRRKRQRRWVSSTPRPLRSLGNVDFHNFFVFVPTVAGRFSARHQHLFSSTNYLLAVLDVLLPRSLPGRR